MLVELHVAIGSSEPVRVGHAFIDHKFDFTAYSYYCTGLARAHVLYDSLMNGDDLTLTNEIIVSETRC